MTALGKAARLPLEPPKQWGYTDEQLATHPLAFRDDLFRDQVFLISGGGSGMGRGMAYLLTRLGAQVMICGRRAEKLEETAAGIRQHLGKEIGTRAMTIRDPEQVNALVAETFDRFGRLDTLVNNGGGQFPQAALEYSVKGWNAVIDTNLNGTWYMMQAAARQWRDRGQPGNIVNIVAVVSRGMPQVAHTCAARAGVIYLSKTLATEWAPLSIRVNCVAPGSIATEGLNVYPRAAAEAFAQSNPMLKMGDVFDIANAVAYLSSPATGSFITGELLAVDGGRQQWGEDWPGGIPEYFRVSSR
ncbi:MAG: SDR family oxidoreductase [Steroidobacteraceae bacterium]|jgi:NAD(P)-dependent dehydrogenase (short-subunit alcohol dehydrogenase family)|nr:SDR family oxidoreductase [Steroidobacteraceae bacterium]